jgi:hypothetical protein
MFRLLKLHPPHGWNAVAWELAIVTLGVLIALAAQQIVEALHDRGTAAETRADVTDELNSDLMSMVLRQSAQPCIDRRLDQLRGIVSQWERTGSFEAPKWVSQAPVIEVELSRYDAGLSAGRLALLSGDEQYRMGAVVARIRKFDEWQMAERVPWGRLRALQAGPAGLSAEDRATIRSALQDASTYNYEARRCRWRGNMGFGRMRKASANWRRRCGRAANSRRRSAPRSTRRRRRPTRKCSSRCRSRRRSRRPRPRWRGSE